jgi:hypothetical protein
MTWRRFESGLTTRPGGSARPATASLRRVGWGTHSRTAVVPSDTALGSPASVCPEPSQPRRIDSFMVRNLSQNRGKFFHLNPVPRLWLRQ